MDDQPPPAKEKILIIRFSSMGDVLLTSPVIRAVKQQCPDVELHYLIKGDFVPVISQNPYIDQIHLYQGDLPATIKELLACDFSYVVDLQHNARSRKIIRSLRTAYKSFPKLNLKKWLYVYFKLNFLPDVHIVDRYFQAVSELGISNDHQGLDFYINPEDTFDQEDLPAAFEDGFVTISLGSMHATKRIPTQKVIEIIRMLHLPIMLLGGKDVAQVGEEIVSEVGDRAFTGCGKYSLHTTASLIKQSGCLLTGDTGLMHIAAALGVPIASLWGNTTPEMGMYPYMPQNRHLYHLFETPRLYCRPCSKLGYKKCPKGNFECMNNISAVAVAEWINDQTV
jgi:ADP-heptose:LPS heptosyltransferase